MLDCKVPGSTLIVPPDPGATANTGDTIHYRIAVKPPVRGDDLEFQVLPHLPDDDLIELEFQNGVRWWMSIAQFSEELQKRGSVRGERDGLLEVPVNWQAQASTRGASDQVLKQLTTSTVDSLKDYLLDLAADPLAKMAAHELVKRIEAKLPLGGVQAIDDPRQPGRTVSKPEDFGGAQRLLLFLHGTGSNTAGSFGDLTGTDEWSSLQQTFKNNIFTFEHKTLSESPIANALALARILPEKSILNLVSHSRGGLVGELLCIANLTSEQLNVFDSASADRNLLEQLYQTLVQKQFTIERFVRVACPSRGTLLASKRLDLYLSVILNLIGMLPIFQGNPFFVVMASTFKKLIAMKADPHELPGLEAMMPGSPLIHLLNRPDLQAKADLAAITGNSHGGPLFQALSTFALDIFYRRKHDFVVNTDAMYGGITREPGAFYFDDSGAGVCHFHYFKNDATRRQMNAWLQAKTGERAGDFIRLEYRERNLIFPSLRGAEAMPILVFIPTLLGTHLHAGDSPVWLNWQAIVPGALDRLAAGHELSVGAPIPHHYESLLNDLGATFEQIAFPYDWRLTSAANAQELANLLAIRLQNGRTVSILAIGSGGLVVERMIADAPAIWRQLRDSKGAAVILASPPAVARSARLLAKGDHKLTRLLAMLDRRSPAEIGRIFAAMPGVQEAAGWTLNQAIDRTFYISGHLQKGDPTPQHCWFIDADPASVAEYPGLGDSIRDLLSSGTTFRLASSPSEPQETPDIEEPLLYPTAQDLADAALGGTAAFQRAQNRLRLSVTHGHLREANYPVAVGHYVGDGIVSAERVLDERLNGRLSQNFNLDLYPGAEGSAEFFDAPSQLPPGALVIGLGEIGKLDVRKLRLGVTMAVLRYALTRVREADGGGQPVSLGVTALLLGTYGGDALSVRDSVEAVVDGVIQANNALQTQKLSDQLRIEEIEFIDLYEDLAIQAAHEIIELERRRHRQDESTLLVAARLIKVAEGGLFHRPGSPYQSGWWRRIRITVKDNAVEFTVLTDRARADLSKQATQDKLIETCIASVVTTTVYDEGLSRLLYELLIPSGFKEQISDRVNLVLVVDESSAFLPWEMLAQRQGERILPLANRVGIIRQLVSSDLPRLRTSRRLRATVIGNPRSAGMERWPNLTQAQDEALEVKKLLEASNYNVNMLVGKEATTFQVLAKVLSENRILHLAGHGVYNKDNPERSGFVIGDDLFLSAAEIANLELLPEIVFVNCCYVGFLPQNVEGTAEPHRLAPSLARQLISMGVKAVVVSGWAVEDQAAKDFATAFYESLLSGTKFGEAVLRARDTVYRRYPKSNSWGAYQCYGNPDFALELSYDSSSPAQNAGEIYVARSEVLERVLDIGAEAAGANEAKRSGLIGRLSALYRAAATAGWNDGEMLSEIGYAYAALGQTNEASDAYERAFADPTSKSRVMDAEQYANLLYRKAEDETDTDKHTKLFDQARTRVLWTLSLSRTAERLALMGSLYKRGALWHKRRKKDELSKESLELALEWYGRGCNPSQTDGPNPYDGIGASSLVFDPYPAANAAAVDLLLREPDQRWRERMAVIRGAADKNAIKNRTFYERSGAVDAAVLQSIGEGSFDEAGAADGFVRRYTQFFSTGTRRRRNSVLSQMELLREMLDSQRWAGAIANMTRLIEELRKLA